MLPICYRERWNRVRVPKRVTSFGLNIALTWKFERPTCLLQITIFWEFVLIFWICLGQISFFFSSSNSRHFWGYIKIIIGIWRCISFFFVCLCNVSKYCFLSIWKSNKVKLGNRLYLWMIFIDEHLNLCYLRECRTMILNPQWMVMNWFVWHKNLLNPQWMVIIWHRDVQIRN